MEYDLIWGEGPIDLTVTVRGRVSVEELAAFTEAALDDPRFRPGMRILVDHRAADWSHMTPDDIRLRIAAVPPDAAVQWGHPRIAWVGSGATFGMGRMMQLLADGQRDLDWHTYNDVAAARAWLASADRGPAQ